MTDHLRSCDAALERLRGLHPKTVDLSLDRMDRICRQLNRPERRLPPVVHVAGTNGKGSTIAFLRAMAEAAGLRVHVFTSPHLVRFAERIRLAGALISPDYLHDVLARVEAANAAEPVTFFEITTAAAFLAFAETPADLCLVEVGMGGRLDATNVVERPAVSVISPVDLDHCEFLGATIDKIAGEKAGVIKPGVPCITAKQADSAFAVIKAVAERMGSPLTVAGRDFEVWREVDGMRFLDRRGLLVLPPPRLLGAHQIENAGLAVATARRLDLSDAAIAEGLRHVVWPARMQRLTAGPLAEKAQARGADLWLDGMHNPHAAAALVQTLQELSAGDGRPLVVVMGLLSNKDSKAMFATLASLKPFRLIVTAFDAGSAAPQPTLAQAALDSGLEAEQQPNVLAAIDAALARDGPPPRVLIVGSLYLAGEVLAMSTTTWPT